MIQLTNEQRQTVESGAPVRLSDNGQDYILMRADVFDQLVEDRHDAEPWEAEELDRLREESVEHLDNFGKHK